MRALLRTLTPFLIIALGGFVIAQAEATPIREITTSTPPARYVVALPTTPEPAPPVAVQSDPDPAPPNITGDLYDPLDPLLGAAYGTDTPSDAPPAAAAVRPTTTSADGTDPPATASSATIEGYDLLEVLLRITGTLTTTPPTAGEPPAAATTTTVTRPIAVSPGAQTTPRTGPLQPSVFERAQIVSFYGYPEVGDDG